MKKKMMVLSFCAAMSVAIIAFAEITPGEKPSPNSEVAQMREEMGKLKAKIELLEYRTKSLESSVEQLKHSHTPTPLSLSVPAPALSTPATRPSRTPPIWGQGEVNGWTYYIVPCAEQGR